MNKRNFAVVENGQLLMCGTEFMLGELTLVISDRDGVHWGIVFAIDEGGHYSTDTDTLNDNDNIVGIREAEREVTWAEVVETISLCFMQDRTPSEFVYGSDVADWEYNNDLFKDVANEVNNELEFEEYGEEAE